MPIIREHERLIKKDLKKITKTIIEQFKILRDSVENKDISMLSKVFILEHEIDDALINSMDMTIEAFSFAPLGKDLRRNISYTFSNKLLDDVSHNAANIATYLVSVNEFNFNPIWLIEITDKIIRRLTALDKLFTSEKADEANKVIAKDKSVNELYKKELMTWSKQLDSIKEKITESQKNEIVQGFILAIKNFEQAGDSIKKIAESSLFISTGKIN